MACAKQFAAAEPAGKRVSVDTLSSCSEAESSPSSQRTRYLPRPRLGGGVAKQCKNKKEQQEQEQVEDKTHAGARSDNDILDDQNKKQNRHKKPEL
jgi:hypothetical protein